MAEQHPITKEVVEGWCKSLFKTLMWTTFFLIVAVVTLIVVVT